MDENSVYVFSPSHQLIVLKAVDEKCGLLGREPIRINIEKFDGEKTSYYCAILTVLGYIKSTSLQDSDKELTYPICITPEGKEMLAEASKRFWQYAESAAFDAVEKLTGIKLHSAAQFFKQTYNKYQLEREI